MKIQRPQIGVITLDKTANGAVDLRQFRNALNGACFIRIDKYTAEKFNATCAAAHQDGGRTQHHDSLLQSYYTVPLGCVQII